MDSEEMRSALRARHQVRVVEANEEGFAARDLPAGVYGFTGSAGLAAPLFAARRYRNFEIHHLRDGEVVIVGFVTPREAEQLRLANAPIALTIYPDVQGEASEIVAIPYSHIAPHREYSIRNTAGLELHVLSLPPVEASTPAIRGSSFAVSTPTRM
jgi:hypothetical protein